MSDMRTSRKKNKLVVCDLDNTLYAARMHYSEGGVVARPFLHNFIDYVLHPDTAFSLAIWTLAGRSYAIAHLRSIGVEIFRDNDPQHPELVEGVVALFGFEDSNLTKQQIAGLAPLAKDLQLMWDDLNTKGSGKLYSALNTLLVDDQVSNAARQPWNFIQAPIFTDAAERNDEFLLVLIGYLEALSTSSNISGSIEADQWNRAGAQTPDSVDHYAHEGRAALRRLGIKIARNLTSLDLDSLTSAASCLSPGPAFESAPSTFQRKGCCQNPPHPDEPNAAARPQSPIGVIKPSPLHVSQAGAASRQATRTEPLVILGLDGVLLARPPCSQGSAGQAVARPYLRSFLAWLLRKESEWKVAIWTSIPEAIAVRALESLELGLVRTSKTDGAPELLHPKLVAFWCREDLDLSNRHFQNWIQINKDLGRLWAYLDNQGKGEWDQTNTVLVDDQASKCLSQPYNLINGPTFFYPTVSTANQADFDSFLLELPAMLDQLSKQSNFSNVIKLLGWFQGLGQDAAMFEKKTRRLLKAADISIEDSSLNQTPAFKQPRAERRPPDSRPVSKPLANDRVLDGTAARRKPTPSTVHTDTESSGSETDSRSDESDDGDCPPIRHRRVPANASSNRFVEEEEELARLHGHPFHRSGSPMPDLREAVQEWELDEPFDKPIVEPLYPSEQAHDYRYNLNARSR